MVGRVIFVIILENMGINEKNTGKSLVVSEKVSTFASQLRNEAP